MSKKQATAVNIFLRQCIIHRGLPFKVEIPQYAQELLNVAYEAKQISKRSRIHKHGRFKESTRGINVNKNI